MRKVQKALDPMLYTITCLPVPVASVELRVLFLFAGSSYLPRKDLKKNCFVLLSDLKILIKVKTFNNGSLGSRIDEERSEMR